MILGKENFQIRQSDFFIRKRKELHVSTPLLELSALGFLYKLLQPNTSCFFFFFLCS